VTDTTACAVAFVAYFVFVIAVILIAKNSGVVQSGLGDLIQTFKELVKLEKRFGAFLTAGLIALRIVINTGFLSFLATGFVAVGAGVCNMWNVDTLKVVRSMLQDLYDFIERVSHPSNSAVSDHLKHGARLTR
jgi:hypothetical protein